jgi:hypothetical protein
MCASAPLSARWWVWLTMICLKWIGIDVCFDSAQPTAVGMVDNDLFKMDWR